MLVIKVMLLSSGGAVLRGKFGFYFHTILSIIKVKADIVFTVIDILDEKFPISISSQLN